MRAWHFLADVNALLVNVAERLHRSPEDAAGELGHGPYCHHGTLQAPWVVVARVRTTTANAYPHVSSALVSVGAGVGSLSRVSPPPACILC